MNRGHTLVELMIATVLLPIFTVAVLSLAKQHRDAERRQAAYAEDLLDCRQALNVLVADLRLARRVDVVERGRIVLALAQGAVTWRLEGHRLYRVAGHSRRRLCGRIAGMTCTVRDGLAEVALELVDRLRIQDRPPATLATSVALTAAERRPR